MVRRNERSERGTARLVRVLAAASCAVLLVLCSPRSAISQGSDLCGTLRLVRGWIEMSGKVVCECGESARPDFGVKVKVSGAQIGPVTMNGGVSITGGGGGSNGSGGAGGGGNGGSGGGTDSGGGSEDPVCYLMVRIVPAHHEVLTPGDLLLTHDAFLDELVITNECDKSDCHSILWIFKWGEARCKQVRVERVPSAYARYRIVGSCLTPGWGGGGGSGPTTPTPGSGGPATPGGKGPGTGSGGGKGPTTPAGGA